MLRTRPAGDLLRDMMEENRKLYAAMSVSLHAATHATSLQELQDHIIASAMSFGIQPDTSSAVDPAAAGPSRLRSTRPGITREDALKLLRACVDDGWCIARGITAGNVRAWQVALAHLLRVGEPINHHTVLTWTRDKRAWPDSHHVSTCLWHYYIYVLE